MINYKIIEVDTNQHSIVVRFYTDKITEKSLAIQTAEDGTILRCRSDFSFDMPIPPLSGAELDSFILSRAPATWFATMEQVIDPSVDTSMTDLKSLIGIEKSGDPTTTVVASSISTTATQAAQAKDADLTAAIQRVLAAMAQSTL